MAEVDKNQSLPTDVPINHDNQKHNAPDLTDTSSPGQEQAIAIAYASNDTSNKRKQPPPESASSIQTRLLVIASFWAIVIFLGIPIWWATTAIYRADLPLSQMLDWAEGRACRPVFPLRISIDAGQLQREEAETLLRSTQHALDDLNDFSAHHLRLQLSESRNTSTSIVFPTNHQDVALLIKLLPGLASEAILEPYEPTLNIRYTPDQIPTTPSSSSTLASYIATQLRNLYAEEQAILAHLLANSASPPDRSPPSPDPNTLTTLTKRTTRSLKYSRNYHLTFSLFTPNAYPTQWPIQSALETHVLPLLESFSPISNFTIDTQIQLYATPGTNSEILSQDDLASFINTAEWPLSPAISGIPTINFILYVDNRTSPLTISGSTSQSWLIPQWGGIILQNSAEDLEPAMRTFTTQLLSLLGLPTSPSQSLPLRLATLTRIHSATLLFSASSTLGSLARLTLALPSIPIPESVAQGVTKTLYHLNQACDLSSTSPSNVPSTANNPTNQNIPPTNPHSSNSNSPPRLSPHGLSTPLTLHHALLAHEEAEKAFFEKSMVGQVYFPDEHKVAVYLPLLGPVGVPLVMGALKEFKAWRVRRRVGGV